MINYYFFPIILIVIAVILYLGYHKEEKFFLILGGFMLLILSIYLARNGLDYVDPDSSFYGEMWNYSSTGYVFNFGAAGVYENLTGLVPGELKGFRFIEDDGHPELLAEVSGVYSLDFSMSFSGGAGGLYGFSITHNHNVDAHRNCYARRAGGSGTGSVSLTCMMDLSAGDTINIQVEDESNPPKSLTIYTVNTNLHKMDDGVPTKIEGMLLMAILVIFTGFGGYLVVFHGIDWIKEIWG